MKNEEKLTIYKVVTVGESDVGKTCIILRYTDKAFKENILSTIGVDYVSKIIDYDENKIKLLIWDTCGQERYNTLAKNMFKGTQGIILVYDISNRDTFINVKKWSNFIKDSAENDVCVLLVGNKLDKNNREVTYEEGENVAKECKFFFIEMSAKADKNIKEGFQILVNEMYKTYGIRNKNDNKITITSSKSGTNNGKKKNCC